jgi:hypothetical protein
MIDTDKYKGHTPAPWEIHGDRICAQAACNPVDNVGGNIATVAYKGVLSDNESNKKLIADAPLLLAEVKRLRMIVAKLENARIESASMFDRPALFDAVREIYEQRLQDIHQEKREEE